MKITEVYPDRWLKAEHLRGHTVTVAIEESSVDNIFNPRTKRSEPKFVLDFYGKKLPMILNKTQALALAQITGSDDSDRWVGHRISLSPSVVPNGAATITISRPPEAPTPTPAPANEPAEESHSPAEPGEENHQ